MRYSSCGMLYICETVLVVCSVYERLKVCSVCKTAVVVGCVLQAEIVCSICNGVLICSV